jgi:hypothetical protein
MPFTSKGIYYPNPSFPPQIVEDMGQLGPNILDRLDTLAAIGKNGPDTIINPSVTYTAPGGGGDLINLPLGAPTNSLLWFQYWAQAKKTVSGATFQIAVFINGNQLKVPVNNAIPALQEVSESGAITGGGFYGLVYTAPAGILYSAAGGTDTQFTAGTGFVSAGAAPIYIWGVGGSSVQIDVRYKLSSGNVVLGQRYILGGVVKGV